MHGVVKLFQFCLNYLCIDRLISKNQAFNYLKFRNISLTLGRILGRHSQLAVITNHKYIYVRDMLFPPKVPGKYLAG